MGSGIRRYSKHFRQCNIIFGSEQRIQCISGNKVGSDSMRHDKSIYFDLCIVDCCMCDEISYGNYYRCLNTGKLLRGNADEFVFRRSEEVKEESNMKNCRCKQLRTIKYKRENKELPALHRESHLNAGYDLFVNTPTPLHVAPGEEVFISLNVATEIPEDMVGLVFQRSSTYRKWGLKLTNGVGVIDALYRGDADIWGAEFKNESDETITLKPGDKVCQAIFLELPFVVLEEVNHLGNEDRGGFGTSFDNAKELD